MQNVRAESSFITLLCTKLHHIMSQNTVIFCFPFTLLNFGSHINILGTQPRLCARQSGVQFQHSMEIFLFSKMSRPALGLTQPRVPWITGALPLGLNSQSIQLGIPFHLGLSLRKGEAIPLQAITAWTRAFLHLFHR